MNYLNHSMVLSLKESVLKMWLIIANSNPCGNTESENKGKCYETGPGGGTGYSCDCNPGYLNTVSYEYLEYVYKNIYLKNFKKNNIIKEVQSKENENEEDLQCLNKDDVIKNKPMNLTMFIEHKR